MKKTLYRIAACLLLASLVFCFSSCGQKPDKENVPKEYEADVNAAIEVLTEKWREIYSKNPDRPYNKTIKIVNTQIFVIDQTPKLDTASHEENYNRFFADVRLVVKFTVLSDYYGMGEDYLQHMGMYEDVVFYEDGICDLQQGSVIRSYAQSVYDFSVDWYTEKVIDCGAAYDRTIDLG